MIESFPEVVREEGVQDWIDAAGIDTFVVIGVVKVVVVIIGVVKSCCLSSCKNLIQVS
jgi:hypothetical protein